MVRTLGLFTMLRVANRLSQGIRRRVEPQWRQTHDGQIFFVTALVPLAEFSNHSFTKTVFFGNFDLPNNNGMGVLPPSCTTIGLVLKIATLPDGNLSC